MYAHIIHDQIQQRPTASVTSALALAAIAVTTSNQPSYAGGNKF
ncbi:hypothetical protein [Fischerella sp.]|nr:hypothetical protein [Fischerella sp.]